MSACHVRYEGGRAIITCNNDGCPYFYNGKTSARAIMPHRSRSELDHTFKKIGVKPHFEGITQQDLQDEVARKFPVK